jgi:hypothetical protein
MLALVKVRQQAMWYVLECIYRMLQSRLFRKQGVSATSWVLQLLQQCSDSEMLPSLLPKIIHELIINSAPHTNYSFHMELLSREQVLSVIDVGQSITSQALMLLYVLYVNNTPTLDDYGPDLLEQFSIIGIVSTVQQERSRLGKLYAQLLPLVIDQLQYSFHLNMLLWLPIRVQSFQSISSQLVTSLLGASFGENQLITISLLGNLAYNITTISEEQVGFVLNMLPKLFTSDSIERALLLSYEHLWQLICLKDPVHVSLRTINILLGKKYSHEDICANVLLLFTVDKRLFALPSTMRIFLQVCAQFS